MIELALKPDLEKNEVPDLNMKWENVLFSFIRFEKELRVGVKEYRKYKTFLMCNMINKKNTKSKWKSYFN